jgi:hypothetical protein
MRAKISPVLRLLRYYLAFEAMDVDTKAQLKKCKKYWSPNMTMRETLYLRSNIARQYSLKRECT